MVSGGNRKTWTGLPCVILVAVTILGPVPAAACSFAGPVDLMGYAVLADLESGRERTLTFEPVSIGGMCEPTNDMDIQKDVALLELSDGVRLFTLDGDLGEITLPGQFPSEPTLDGEYVYYLNSGDGSLRRVHWGTRTMDVLFEGIPDTFGVNELLVADGIAAWGYDNRVSVFDTATRTLLLNASRIPVPDLAFVPVGLHAGRLTLLGSGSAVNGTLVVTFDWATNETVAIAELPMNGVDATANHGTAAQDGDRLAYLHDGLHVLNLTSNATTDYPQRIPGVNLAFAGSLIAYNRYETTRPWDHLVRIAIVGIAVIAGVFAFAVLRRPRAIAP